MVELIGVSLKTSVDSNKQIQTIAKKPKLYIYLNK